MQRLAHKSRCETMRPKCVKGETGPQIGCKRDKDQGLKVSTWKVWVVVGWVTSTV